MSPSSSQTSTLEWTPKIPRPISFTKPLVLEDKLLMIPGPTNASPRVLKAMTAPVIGLTDPQFFRLQSELQTGIRYLFQTKNEYTFALTGAGTCGMETALVNLLLPGQKLLTLSSGHWGKRVGLMGERLSLEVVRLEPKSLNEVYSFEALEEALRIHRPQLMYVCHGDSSLGTLQPLVGLGDLCHRYDCTLLVDAVVSLCTAPLAMDEMAIDVLFSAAQKALSGPSGLAMISFSERAVAIYKARSAVQAVSCFYMDIGLVARAWEKNFTALQYHYTHAISGFYGLREAIAMVVEEGIESVIRRHRQVQVLLERALQEELGLQLFTPNPEHRLAGVACAIVPADIDGNLVMSILDAKYGIAISPSHIPASATVPSFWRIGYLGVNANSTAVRRLVDAFKEVLADQRRSN